MYNIFPRFFAKLVAAYYTQTLNVISYPATAQSAETVEYTDCITEEGLTLLHEWSGYDIKQSDGEAPVLELWKMWSTPSLSLIEGPHWPTGVTRHRTLSSDQIELFNI